ncbi:MAG TPA: aromatic amino acid ammonia-lyase [Clostridia bacterium]|nr:aromatic amino acid ammonia-lyase [Clostridia bacterium]
METVYLNGKELTIEQVAKVARRGARVEITPEAMNTLKASRQLVFDLVDCNVPVYGFNTGVGWNKDKRVFKEFFQEYNRNLIYSHCLGVEPYASEEEVRAIMLARLNTLLVGATGIQPEIAVMYSDMLNAGVHPVIPERGSVGEADIACLSHIGLAMLGEGEVFYKGKKVSAAEALKKANLMPVTLGPKDGLAIVSSNALAAGEGALVLNDIKDLLDISDVIYALSLEGLNGNVSPLDMRTHRMRPYTGQAYSAERITEYLEGSYIWEPDWKKPVQDPLSFRGSAHVHGAVRDSLAYVQNLLTIQLNSSDDNPCIIMEDKKIISCSNFEVTNWSLGFEMLGMALSQLSKVACHRIIKLGNPAFTKLSRFLSPADNVLAFATIQKTFTALDTEIRHLSNPAVSDFFALAGDMEDHANNAPYIVQKTRKIVDDLFYILGIEAMHAAQAVDLRSDIKIGKGTKAAYNSIRETVPFYDKDRNLSIDIRNAYEILRSGKLLSKVKAAMEE